MERIGVFFHVVPMHTADRLGDFPVQTCVQMVSSTKGTVNGADTSDW